LTCRLEILHYYEKVGDWFNFKRLNFLQVYAQHFHHLESFIEGNNEGLIELRNAIDQALEKGTGKANLFPSDDEGYELYVPLIPDEEQKAFSLLELP